MRKFKSKNQESLLFLKKLNVDGFTAKRVIRGNKSYIYIFDKKNGKIQGYVRGNKYSDYERKKGVVIGTKNTIQTTKSYDYKENKNISENAKRVKVNLRSNSLKTIRVKLKTKAYVYQGQKSRYISSNMFRDRQGMRRAEDDLAEKLRHYDIKNNQIESVEVHEIKKR